LTKGIVAPTMSASWKAAVPIPRPLPRAGRLRGG